jgi:EXLDI family protein
MSSPHLLILLRHTSHPRSLLRGSTYTYMWDNDVMPNKTIYVSDNDLPLFERAQSLVDGNLSAAIAQALAEYVRSAEVDSLHQYDSFTVSVGPAGSRRKKRFTAVCLARWQHAAGKAGSVEELVAYWTTGERVAVHRRIGPWHLSDPGQIAGLGRPRHSTWAGPALSIADAEAWDEQSNAVLEVYDTTDEFAAHVPPEFANLVADAVAALQIEELDI